MSAKDAHLYGIPRPKKNLSSRSKEITSTNTFAFSTALSSLISAAKPTASNALPISTLDAANVSLTGSKTTSSTAPGRPRHAKAGKSDIFATQNRNTAKRAAADMLALEQDTRHAAARVDETSWRRTKKKMEEKARLYAAMKRGDVEDEGERHMVDFDRKWADRKDVGADTSDDEDEDDDEEEEKVEYTDEFGRTRVGTRAEAAREERRRKGAAQAADEPDRFSARPVAPSGIIYGDTVQAAAFNPDEVTTVQMEELAAKRDRDLTPPPEAHYDADWEIRTKGTGFFKFAKDEEERRTQMENLYKERDETERARKERQQHDKGEIPVENEKEKRKKEIEKRRQMIQAKRGKMQADKFLQDLGGEIVENKEDAAKTGDAA